MAPEQHDPAQLGRPTGKADVWAWGCVMAQMLGGAVPWAGLRPMQIQMQVAVHGKAPPLPAGLPGHLAALLARCLARRAADRPAAAEALAGLRAVRADPHDAAGREAAAAVQVMKRGGVASSAAPLPPGVADPQEAEARRQAAEAKRQRAQAAARQQREQQARLFAACLSA